MNDEEKMKHLRNCLILLAVSFVWLTSLNGEITDSMQVGPGVMYYSETRSAGPWEMDVVVIDLENPWLSFKTVKANNRLQGHEKTSSMASRNNFAGHRVVAAINGDFYDGTGLPIGAQVSNGQVVKTDFAWKTIGLNDAKVPFIADIGYGGMVWSDSANNLLHNINAVRSDNQLILYNPFFGYSTGSNAYGSEALIRPLEGWIVNDTMRCVVEEIQTNQGNMVIPSGKAVLSGHGESAGFIGSVSAGDTLSIAFSMRPAPDRLMNVIGGNEILVQNGQNIGASGDRHPRTAAGFNADSTKFYFFTVDGRQPGYSVGMSYYELAAYMLEWGVYQGLNLDGGGSTTMLVRGEIKNSPSDPGGERTVANSLLLISAAPDSNLAYLRLSPKKVTVIGGSQVQFSVQGLDIFYNHVSLDTVQLLWECDSVLGSITESGLFTASEDTVSGYIYVRAGEIADSALVQKSILNEIILTPDPVILKVGEIQQMNAEAYDNFGNLIAFALSDYEWSVTNELGSISESGLFSATTIGEGEILAEYAGVSGAVSLTVGINSSVIVDNFTNVSNYSLSGVNVNLAGCSLIPDTSVHVSAPHSGKLAYSLTTGGTSALYMNCTIPISGTPDVIGVWVYGDGKNHWLRGEFEDHDGEKFLFNFTEASPGIDWLDEWRYLEVPLENAIPSWSNPSAVLNYPITWKRFYLVETNDNNKDSGVIWLDDFQVDFITTDIETPIPQEFHLEQNFPNPFNASTTIRFAVPPLDFAQESAVLLQIFDIQGRLIKTLVDDELKPGHYEINFHNANLASGIYLYQLSVNGAHITKKMALLK
jgi:exopolysaccharide biosynthesis protein